jgi:hypothetical protein
MIAVNHEPIFAAHPGRERTLERLCLSYYWPGVKKDVQQFIKEKISVKGVRGLLNI